MDMRTFIIYTHMYHTNIFYSTLFHRKVKIW